MTALRRKLADNLQAYVFLAAGIACFALFSWWPLVKGVILSFQQVNFVTDPIELPADPLLASAPITARLLPSDTAAWLKTPSRTAVAE